MKLTGKCKEDFEKWYKVKYYPCHYGMTQFNELHNSMQYGVYVDFFDSVGIEVEVRKVKKSNKFISFSALSIIKWALDKHDTRPEARIKAIEKANELYNSL